jgi:hydroxyquinol 1,2-dioxygenase
MRQFTEDNLTDEVVARFRKGARDARFKQVMTSLVKHLHAFAKDVQLTEEEWFEAIKFLTAVGQKCDGKRQEFILLSDVLGLSMMTVAKEFGYGGDLREGATMKGEDVWVSGKVTSVDGKPIPGAALDIWQAKADGIYDLQTEGEFELRGRVKANAKGEYAFKSYKPKFYSIPMDGPVGDLVRAVGDNHMRPAHMHAIVSAPGYQQVITHVFVEGDPYLDGDAVFAVKNSLVGKYTKLGAADAKKHGLPEKSLKLEFNFKLAPDRVGAKKARKKIAASDAVA